MKMIEGILHPLDMEVSIAVDLGSASMGASSKTSKRALLIFCII